MTEELPEVLCPECDAIFSVIWHYAWQTVDGPHFCPFCGSEIDYADNAFD